MCLIKSREEFYKRSTGHSFYTRYENHIRRMLTDYKMTKNVIDEFLDNTVFVGFGVEQISRGVLPNNHKFFSKDKEFLDYFLNEYKEIMKKNKTFMINSVFEYFFHTKEKNENIYFEIYKNPYPTIEAFFCSIDLSIPKIFNPPSNCDLEHNNCAYDFKDNKIWAKNMTLFNSRVLRFNREKNNKDFWEREILCENKGGEWSRC